MAFIKVRVLWRALVGIFRSSRLRLRRRGIGRSIHTRMLCGWSIHSRILCGRWHIVSLSWRITS